mgnify:CR=1 FL=1
MKTMLALFAVFVASTAFAEAPPTLAEIQEWNAARRGTTVVEAPPALPARPTGILVVMPRAGRFSTDHPNPVVVLTRHDAVSTSAAAATSHRLTSPPAEPPPTVVNAAGRHQPVTAAIGILSRQIRLLERQQVVGERLEIGVQ